MPWPAALVVRKVSAQSLIFVNAMIPVPGETPGHWWENTGALQARAAAAEAGGYGDFDLATYFLHDIAAEGQAHQRPETDAVFAAVCDFPGWPAISTRVLSGAQDRFFPVEFQRALARERLGNDEAYSEPSL
jgi:hypothetical protein